jgi:hypothetical protein
MHQLEIFVTTLGVRMGAGWFLSDSWPFRKVRKQFYYYTETFANDLGIATKAYSNCADFRQFRRQLFHASLATIFSSLKAGMTQSEVAKFPDGHFRRMIWALGPYIADYPEQVLLTCIVQGWCARYVLISYTCSIV